MTKQATPIPPQLDWAREPLSEVLCWSRMQTEAGQPLQEILDRKNLERQANGGLFFWGVGNAPGRAIRRLVGSGLPVDVVFSTMKTKPRQADVKPAVVCVWRRFTSASGEVLPLPSGVLVTSRGSSRGELKDEHYALMCHSPLPLTLGDWGPFDSKAYRNFGGTGAPIGASQVTALLKYNGPISGFTSDYRINMRARLVGSYWVKLLDPIKLDLGKNQSFSERISNSLLDGSNWCDIVNDFRKNNVVNEDVYGYQPSLFREG